MKNLEWLYSLGPRSVLGLDKIKQLLEKLNNPQDKLKCIHVTGTNGKGSVCAILSSILTKAGYKVGMYTSPHLKRFTERFQINGKEIQEERLNQLIEKVKPYHTDQTFFEITTAIAFLYFAEENVDFLVLEVGLGGRLDATNVITPLLSIITNISLEHTQILGETEEKIAYEKAGIIKKAVPTITLAKGSALKVIKKIAKENNSKLFSPKIKKNLSLNLKGEFQIENASIALKAVELLKDRKITKESIKKGLNNINWPGRFEFIEDNILVDCAHNPDATKALKNEIKKIRKKYAKVISVVGILNDKDKKAMVRDISSFSDYLIFTKPKIERASNPGELSLFTNQRKEIIPDVNHALKKAKKIANKEDLILVTGSIYTVGEVKYSRRHKYLYNLFVSS
ncbi:MAG: bifunctional folylpolyglutamate synthase/dihydrofolate synthase [Nanoarchaeota archaeon]|nr:bifunctional folylpolyglutamate synthase/dihydrofolate synthase [Nanoarchaeota archaeon]